MRVAIIGGKEFSREELAALIAQLPADTQIAVEKGTALSAEVERLAKERGLTCRSYAPRWKDEEGRTIKNAAFATREYLVRSSDRVVLVGEGPIIDHALQQAKKHDKGYQTVPSASSPRTERRDGPAPEIRSSTPAPHAPEEQPTPVKYVAIIGDKEFSNDVVRAYVSHLPTDAKLAAVGGTPLGGLVEQLGKERGLEVRLEAPRWKDDDGSTRKNAAFQTREVLINSAHTVLALGDGPIAKHARAHTTKQFSRYEQSSVASVTLEGVESAKALVFRRDGPAREWKTKGDDYVRHKLKKGDAVVLRALPERSDVPPAKDAIAAKTAERGPAAADVAPTVNADAARTERPAHQAAPTSGKETPAAGEARTDGPPTRSLAEGGWKDLAETRAWAGRNFQIVVFGQADRSKHQLIAELAFRVPREIAYEVNKTRAALDAQLPTAKSLGLTSSLFLKAEDQKTALAVMKVPLALEDRLGQIGAEAKVYRMPPAPERKPEGTKAPTERAPIADRLSKAAPTPLKGREAREEARATARGGR